MRARTTFKGADTAPLARLGRRLVAFFRNERAAAGVYIALTAPVMFGATALAIDLSRDMALNSQLQNAADAAALAGAAELNGQNGALDRATAAAQGAFGTNVQTFANDGLGSGVGIQSITFLSSLTAPDPALLPPDPGTAGGTVTTNDKDAQFIRVAVQNRSIANTLIEMVGGPAASSTTAVAVAGFQEVLCNVVPLMICNPLEDGASPGGGFNPPVGSEILIHTKGSGAQWAPGVYGFIDPPQVRDPNNSCEPQGTNQGTPDVTQFLAMAGPNGCTTGGLNVRPGNPTPAAPGLNVRFDLFPKTGGQLGGNANNNACYAPAPDVTKGMVPGTTKSGKSDPCSPQAAAAPAAEAFPHDDCLVNNNCTIPQAGDGNWDLNTYWQVNHGGTPPAGLTTRYSVYQYEIDNNAVPVAGSPSGHVEAGAPACYSGPASAETADRRTINVAIVDCLQQGVNGNANNIQPIAVMKGFITTPVDPATGDVYIEVEKVIQQNAPDGIIHTLVQLYR